MTVFRSIPTLIALYFIKFYRHFISPLFPSCCRYTPSCSEYAFQAFTEFGFIKGFYLSMKRILRCHPGGSYGYDPIPDK